ncbi:hypothetical protein [Paractinoplanes brasiliensis]|uniref:hypothetical protein n=1 Tax=Paractinoplanes brasiliensis TaxID=52695 RepID=UPI001061D25E|nr:hypothetical protein [Actinoplanes brasiliensis]
MSVPLDKSPDETAAVFLDSMTRDDPPAHVNLRSGRGGNGLETLLAALVRRLPQHSLERDEIVERRRTVPEREGWIRTLVDIIPARDADEDNATPACGASAEFRGAPGPVAGAYREMDVCGVRVRPRGLA